MVCLNTPYHFKSFKDFLPQIVLSPFLNTLSHMYLNGKSIVSLITFISECAFIVINLYSQIVNFVFIQALGVTDTVHVCLDFSTQYFCLQSIKVMSQYFPIFIISHFPLALMDFDVIFVKYCLVLYLANIFFTVRINNGLNIQFVA